MNPQRFRNGVPPASLSRDDEPGAGVSPDAPSEDPFETFARGLPDPLEVRATPRVAVECPVQIYATDFAGGLVGLTRDLSIGGACLATPSPFAAKSVQSVRISLPSGELNLEAMGCWQGDDPHSDQVLTGVAFPEPPSEAIDQIWDQVLESGKKMARFLYERTPLREFGLEEAMGLAQAIRYRSVAPGELIFEQGSRNPENDSLFFLEEGRVSLRVRTRAGEEHILSELEPGALFGGLSLLAEMPQPESAVAESSVRVLELDCAAFRRLRTVKPWLGQRLGAALLRVHAERMARLLDLAGESRSGARIGSLR